MKTLKFSILLYLFTWIHNSFCQSSYDSTFIQNIINLELKSKDEKMKTAYPIFEISAVSDYRLENDTLFTVFLLGKEIKWESFGVKSEYGFFTDDVMVDSCFYIYAPVFNRDLNQFTIQFETRFQNDTSYFTTDYYSRKKRKWSFDRSVKSFSF